MKTSFWMPTSRFSGAQIAHTRLALPRPLGIRAVFVSDVHRSRHLTHAHLLRLAEQIQDLHPDLLLLGGDYGESVSNIQDTLQMLGQISAQLGRFGVVGNNDGFFYEQDMTRLRDDANCRNIRLLINEAVETDLFCIAGLQEMRRNQPEYRDYFAGQEKKCRLLLAHYPQAIHAAMPAMSVKPHMAMAGHTHGGQFALGRLTPYSIGFEKNYGPMPTAAGETMMDGVHVLVSHGIGTSKLPLRLFVPPQIHAIEL